MQKFSTWTLEAIRSESSDFSWMEEYRFDWIPLVHSVVSDIINGQTVLIVTDESSRWFGHYIQHKINDISKNRPLLPFYQLSRLLQNLNGVSSTQDLQLVEDMLDISFPNGYAVWYIGKSEDACTKLPFKKENSFMWIMDEPIERSFPLRSSDPQLDIKLLQLFKLFDATLSAVLFGEIELDQ